MSIVKRGEQSPLALLLACQNTPGSFKTAKRLTKYISHHPSVKAKALRGSGLVNFSTIQAMLRLSGTNVEVTPYTKFLLHHCKLNVSNISRVGLTPAVLNHRSESLCTVTVETGWLKYAIRGPALFDSTLYHWALLNYNSLPEAFQHPHILLQVRGIAIQKVNALLHAQRIVSDELIASVACLANANVRE